MYLMSRFSFGRIEGYDLSPELVRIANDNFQRLEVQKCRAAQEMPWIMTDTMISTIFYI